MASSLSIAILAALHDRPTVDEIISWIDVETILLLFTMMILVGILTETGVFDYLAVYAYKVSSICDMKYSNTLVVIKHVNLHQKENGVKGRKKEFNVVRRCKKVW